jgi:choline dehydrogenase
MNELTFDYIIVGAGTAGALLANRLSANASKRVLLIEAGGKDDYHWIHIPVGYLYCIGNPRTDWLYHTEAQTGLNGRSLRYPRGKVLGGCSSINGMIYMRGQSRDYAQWANATQDDNWNWSSCLEDFKFHEDHYLGANAFHGAKHSTQHHPTNSDASSVYEQTLAFKTAGGEWRVEKQRLDWPILNAFAKACEQHGIAPTNDFNAGNNEGVGYFEVNQRSGWRWNTAKAFLRPACYARDNFEMWTRAQVCRVLLETSVDGIQRCSGVEVFTGQEKLIVNARHEVILCAGSIGSPHILQLSGIGDPTHLKSIGIVPLVDLPGVGENLQDHLQIRTIFKVSNTRTLNTLSKSWWGKAKMGLEFMLSQSGPMSMAPSQLGVFTKSDAALEWPDLQYHVQPLSLEAFGEPLHDFDAITASVCNLNPSSRGHVHAKTPYFQDPPLINPNYLSTKEDMDKAAKSIALTRKIVAQKALLPFAPQEIKPGAQFQSEEDLSRLAGDIGTTIFHPVGTAQMGRLGAQGAVLDSQMRVQNGRGGIIHGLRVVDASAMPTITSGNTNSPTLMMAEKAAKWIAVTHAN